MSDGGRLIRLNSVRTSLAMFMLSFLPVLSILVFWHSDENNAKYRLARRDILYRPKDQGGLGIEHLEIKNKCFLVNGFIGCLSKIMQCGYSYCVTIIYTYMSR